MSSVHYLFLFGNILMIFISLTNTVNLDIPCENNTVCGGPDAICQGGRCQCDTPYYTPCGTSTCKIKEKFVYEGGACRVHENCLDNAECRKNENLCRCMTDYTPINGLCYKSLNANCTNSSECWSGECRNNICQCPLGFISRNDDKRCQRKLANIYENWTVANAYNDFCYPKDHFSCLVSSAICQNDSQHLEHFCQCPPTHTADYDKQECQLKVYSGLSPSNAKLPSDGCGKCQVNDAICADVGNQTTCWCRASFTKNGDKCVKNRSQPFIFPNHNDLKLHNYTSNCSTYENNSLCTCAPGYKFVNQTSCQPIKPEWKDDHFEYGVCTHIDSNGKPRQEDGLCPTPLKCEARQDKYVCSCGRDRYLDEETNFCHYFLERNLTAPINSSYCPVNSTLKDNKCQCEPMGIFSVSLDNKRCELKLNETGDSQEKPLCDTSNITGDASCAHLFGGNAKFCRKGECRCMLNSSYYANNTCVTLIYVLPVGNASCPANADADNTTGVCECKTGYRVNGKDNRTCERKVERLVESVFWNLTVDDCKALFPSQPVNVSNNTCICDTGAFLHGNMCIFYLGHSSNDSMIPCPKNANASSGSCKCNPGYKQMSNTTCEQWKTTVYRHNEITGENLTGIELDDCIALFGSAADISENKTFCRCKNESVAFWHDNKCYFLVETNVGEIDHDSTCPPNSEKITNRCKCLPGYQTNSSNTVCERKPIYSSDLQAINIHTFGTKCNASYTDNDCEALHGIGAVCRANRCYCDRSQSYVVRNNRCELFSRLIFPGIHEYYLYTCDVHHDCGDNADKNGIECEFFNENYRVCQCKKDYFFNPIDSTCVQNQCYPTCSNTEECQNYQCNCKSGYYRDSSGQCVKYDRSWKLHDQCNQTYWNPGSEGLECSSDCQRVRCVSGYRDDSSNCVKYRFDDHCVHDPNFCSNLSPGSQCDTIENKCVCLPDYYQTEGTRICARGVGLSCVDSIDCGEFGDCLNRVCVCKAGRIEKETHDFLGRKIKTCVNGIDQIRFNPVIFFFILIIRVLFA